MSTHKHVGAAPCDSCVEENKRLRSALTREKEARERAETALRIAVSFMSDEEWSAWRSSDGGREDFVGAECCPDCGGMKAHGHLTVCRLVNALSRARAALSGTGGTK